MAVNHSEHALESYKSMLSFSMEAMKAMLLLHSGAIVATMTYLGQHHVESARAVLPLACFVVGIVFTMLGFLCAYLTQHAVFNETKGRHLRIPHRRWQWLGVAAGAVSLGSFGIGALTAIFYLVWWSPTP